MTRALLAAATAALILALTSCSDDNGEGNSMNDLSSTPPAGEQLSEFVPQESVVTALGTEEIDARGGGPQIGSDNILISAGSEIYVDSDPALTVTVEQAVGMLRTNFEERLASDDYSQLPDDTGLGFTFSEDDEHDGETVEAGSAWLAHGNYVVRVNVLGLAEGRDHEADAVALAQQVVQTLQLPEDWTLPGEPLARASS